MSFDVWFLYFLSIFVVIMIPGPLSLFMVSSSLKQGVLKSYPVFLGGSLASCMYLIISAVGLGAMIVASNSLFLALKFIGALYLIYLGLMTIRNSLVNGAESQDRLAREDEGSQSGGEIFKKSFLLGASNPKDILFFMAFLPQFISQGENLQQQIVVIVLTWLLVDLLCKLFYGLLARMIKPYLNTPGSIHLFDRSTGVLFISAGVAAAFIGL